MTQTDLIILAVYLICIFYVIRQAWNSLDERTKITNVGNQFDYDPLKDFIKIEFKFREDARFKFSEQPQILETTVSNSSRTATITIDWDRGSLTNFDGSDRRLIRLTDNLQKADIAKQTIDTILPKGRREFKLAPEASLKENPDTEIMEPTAPIIDVQKLAKDKDAKPKLKDTYRNFMEMREPLKFSLRLPLQITNVTEGGKKEIWGFVDCDFTVARMPRIEHVPWNPKPAQKK